MEGVAEEAGVGKTTVYRRYRDKAELATAAIAHVKSARLPPDLGDARAELLEHLRRFHKRMEGGTRLTFLGTLLAEQPQHPELMERFREAVVAPLVASLRAALERGIERGQVRADADLDIAMECTIGAFLAAYIAGHELAGDWPERVVDTIWPALAA